MANNGLGGNIGAMKDSRANLLLAIGLVSALGAMISSFAAGSHFEISSLNGVHNYDVKLGAAGSAPTSCLGLIAFVAFAGVIGLHLSRPGSGSANPSSGATGVGSGGFAEFTDVLRRLTKSRTDIWVGGVCGGLGEHTPLPAWVWRVAFLFFLFCYGIGGPLYLCLWICLPQPADDAQIPSPRAAPYGN